MATPLEALQSRSNLMQNTLYSSPTAYAPNTAPSSSDVSTASQIASVNKQIEDLKSKQLRNQWYGATDPNATTDAPAAPTGFVMGALKALQQPLNVMAGTAQYALGKGTESSLLANIQKARDTGLTFGNILKQSGTPRAVQIPLGFALDVMFDPINWATAGTAALIPRIGTGLVKGAIEEGGIKGAMAAATAGATSNLAKKAATTMKYIPFAGKIPGYTNLRSTLGEAAVSGAEKFNTLTGTTVADRLGKGVFNQSTGALGNKIEDLIRSVPSTTVLGKQTWSGDSIADFFKYSPRTAAEVTDLHDKITMLGRNEGMLLTKEGAGVHFTNIEDFKSPAAQVQIIPTTGKIVDAAIPQADGVVVNIRDTSGTLKPEFVAQIKVLDSQANAEALLATAGDDYNVKHLVKAYHFTPIGKTGVTWYDDFIDKAKATTYADISNFVKSKVGGTPTATEIEQAALVEGENAIKAWNSINAVTTNVKEAVTAMTPSQWHPFEKILTGLEKATAVFKMAKVALNVSSHPVAIGGNYIMGAMMGIPVHDLEYTASLLRARKLLGGGLGAKGIKDLLFNDLNNLIDMADNNPARFRALFGFDPSEIVGHITTEQKVRGMIPTKFADTKSYLMQAERELDIALEEAAQDIIKSGKISDVKPMLEDVTALDSGIPSLTKKVMKEKVGEFSTPSKTTAAVLSKSGGTTGAEEIGTFTTSELQNQQIIDAAKVRLSKLINDNPDNVAYKMASMFLNGLPKAYEHIDQSFKIATTDFLSRIGVTEQQLITMSRTIPIDFEKDIIGTGIRNSEKVYRIAPLKAGEIATEAFMNYAAMPDFVKVMRAIPIAGSNFYSFQYAMAIKASKTAINNPAIFNKVSFMLSEISGSRSPEEKVALENKYNSYLNSPTVIKVMGMWNTDVKNIVPYYTMNMFNPSDKTYADTPQGNILKMSDKLPFFQTPVGSVLKDYVFQPWVLSGTGQAPQGQFGQPIMPTFDIEGKPINPSLGTRAFYGGRTLTEAFVPGAASFVGLPIGKLGTSPEIINLIPSYGVRSLANASQGRSSIGATTKEAVMQKTFRSLLGKFGIPAYTLDTTNNPKP